MATRIFLVLLVLTGVASAQTAPTKLTVGIFAPTAEFDTAQVRLAYVQGIAKAIEQSTGIPTTGDSYASLSALKKANPDYAIIEGQCFAASPSGKLLANANISGSTSRVWGLYSSSGDTMQALKGKKLAYVTTGCNDDGFIDNAMLDSEVNKSFFSRSGERDLKAAIASVTSYKTAQAVFAPAAAAKGLTKVFDTIAVPNPAFVELNGNVPQATSSKVAAAVVGYGGSGAITGWTAPSREPYQALAGHLGPVRKTGMFASPEPARLDSRDVLVDPPTLKEPQLVEVRHHFLRTARMD